MKSLVRKLIWAGAIEAKEQSLIDRIKLLNAVTLVTMTFGLLYMLIALFINELFFVPVLALNTFLASIVFILNKKGLYVTSRLYFLTLVNVGLLANCFLFGKASGIHFFYLVSASVPFIFFRRNEYKLILLTSLQSVLLFTLVQLNLTHPQYLLNESQLDLLYEASMIGSFFWTVFNFYYIGKKNDQAVELINEQKATIEGTLQQKEILLQEVHHRVKNNLQIVMSLLNLQSSTVLDKKAQEKFKESADRIRSIASVHELLYSSADLTSICLKDYTEELIDNLIKSSTGPETNVIPNFDIQHIHLNLEKAIPLGLIINEVFTNSIKYAIKDNQVNIGLTIIAKNGKVIVTASDSGRGFNFDKELDKENSIGLLLISELTNQLDGELKRDINETGTSYMITFEV